MRYFEYHAQCHGAKKKESRRQIDVLVLLTNPPIRVPFSEIRHPHTVVGPSCGTDSTKQCTQTSASKTLVRAKEINPLLLRVVCTCPNTVYFWTTKKVITFPRVRIGQPTRAVLPRAAGAWRLINTRSWNKMEHCLFTWSGRNYDHSRYMKTGTWCLFSLN